MSNIVAFHSQQAVEKSLKSLLEYYNRDVPKIHSLNRLFKLCEEYIQVDDNSMINTLDSLYIESRYPGDLGLLPNGKPGKEDAVEFYDFAKKIFDDIQEHLDLKI